MSNSAAFFTASLEVLADAAARAGAEAPGSRALGDDELLMAQRTLADVKRHVDACAAVLAGETVRRSSSEAGLGGLARKQGFRTPEALVRGITGSTSREASTLVRVGSMLNDADLVGRRGSTWTSWGARGTTTAARRPATTSTATTRAIGAGARTRCSARSTVGRGAPSRTWC